MTKLLQSIKTLSMAVFVATFPWCFDVSAQVTHLDFEFENTLSEKRTTATFRSLSGKSEYSGGLMGGRSLSLKGIAKEAYQLSSNSISLGQDKDFSVSFWIRSTAKSDDRFTLLSKKKFPNNSLESQRNSGWVFYYSNGTWAWNIGSGNRRLTYERDNGARMPMNDGRWHQLVMTYQKKTSTIRLYFDGINRATYNVLDTGGFDFSNEQPVTIGWNSPANSVDMGIVQKIKEGAESLQNIVDRFRELGWRQKLTQADLMALARRPKALFQSKWKSLRQKAANQNAADNQKTLQLLKKLKAVDLNSLDQLSRKLGSNPYTVHQAVDFMLVAPLMKIYRIENGKIAINERVARNYSRRESLQNPSFDIDKLSLVNRCLTAEQVKNSYNMHFTSTEGVLPNNRSTINVAIWNIHHGGIHETFEEDGWDSRKIIAEIIRRGKIDVLLMQETYSNGDFIAAELGYYFATTVDWDYLNQGSNISVLSRFPIESIDVPTNSPFMNVCAKIVIANNKHIYAMSNWYGMSNFPKVAKHHKAKFDNADRIPVFFGGDFNAVPHTDGGRSPASKFLLGDGFKDAYRELYPDVKKFPGPSHRGGSRIDQLYFKGKQLKLKSTKVVSSWPSIFPSDHFLVKGVFELVPAGEQEPSASTKN